jgi:hypothetical protein
MKIINAAGHHRVTAVHELSRTNGITNGGRLCPPGVTISAVVDEIDRAIVRIQPIIKSGDG